MGMTRQQAHDEAVRRRVFMMLYLERETSAVSEFRGGIKVRKFIHGDKTDELTRKISDRHAEKSDGLDVLITYGNQKIWASLFPDFPTTRRMFPNRDILRVQAPNPGFPKTKVEVMAHFRRQWAIMGFFIRMEDEVPVMFQAVEMGHFFSAGYGKNKGYFFPNQKGRRNTVFLYTKGVSRNIITKQFTTSLFPPSTPEQFMFEIFERERRK